MGETVFPLLSLLSSYFLSTFIPQYKHQKQIFENQKLLHLQRSSMGRPAAETTPTSATHLYPQALQLKLYQSFIFSIPILFSIILFLLFYLFYLKRRATSSNHFSSNSQQTRVVTRISTQPTPYLSFVSLYDLLRPYIYVQFQYILLVRVVKMTVYV